MSGVVVVAEASAGRLRPSTLELISAARSLSAQGAGPVAVALIGAEAQELADAVDLDGVAELLLIPAPVAHFEAHVAQAALEAIVAQRAPAVVLAGHTVQSLGFMPAVASRLRLGFASDVLSVHWEADRVRAGRGAYGQRLVAELEFPGKPTVLVLVRGGAFAAAAPAAAGSAIRTFLELDLDGAPRSTRIELREPPAGEVDITRADFLLSVGRGVEDAERIAELELLAARIGATLSASRPLVDAGWVSSERQVGQSGRTVAPKVYLALGISGALQHVAGMSKARLIIAVNSDPQAPIFDVAHHGAVADLFEVATELAQQLG
jgi:electron transfer flavoprotein alpha subunit